MKIYYAHCMTIYNTPQEMRDLEVISKIFPKAEIYNPNNDESQKGYDEIGMEYFYRIIKTCNLLIFRGIPYGKIPTGVFGEIDCARINNIPVLELPSFIDRKMSVDDTRLYLRECGFR